MSVGLHMFVAATLTLLLWQARAARETGEERLIGWRGETYKPDGQTLQDEKTGGTRRKWIETISWKPRAFIYHNFLSEEEANHIVKLAAPQMKRSTVVGTNGASVTDEIRTSYGTFLRRTQDDVIKRVEERLANWTHIPVVNQEDMQVLRYGVSQKYGAHYDSLDDESPRVCTVLIYLYNTEEGGETAFPVQSQWVVPEQAERNGPFSDCAKGHVAFKPKKGDALLFWSMKPGGNIQDAASMHTGCPVLKGFKWTATIWIHSLPFRAYDFSPKVRPLSAAAADPGVCADTSPKCKTWVAAGECERNPAFMTGGEDDSGVCRKSCKVCKDCAPGNATCLNENRAKLGYLVLAPEELKLVEEAPLGD